MLIAVGVHNQYFTNHGRYIELKTRWASWLAAASHIPTWIGDLYQKMDENLQRHNQSSHVPSPTNRPLGQPRPPRPVPSFIEGGLQSLFDRLRDLRYRGLPWEPRFQGKSHRSTNIKDRIYKYYIIYNIYIYYDDICSLCCISVWKHKYI
jgi:hypothetical protein